MGLRMANPSRRNGSTVFQFRMATPAAVLRAKKELAKFGIKVRREETVSLRTADVREAKRRFALLTAQHQQQWQEWLDLLRTGHRVLTQKEIFAVVAEMVRDMRRRVEDFPGDPEWWTLMAQLQAIFRDHPEKFLFADDILGDHRQALELHLAKRYGWHAIAPHSMKALLAQYVADLPKAMEARAALASGDYRVPDWLEARPQGGDALLNVRNRQAEVLPFSRIMDHWKAMRGPTPSSVRSYTTRIKSLTDFLGHDDAARLTDDDVRRWRDALIDKGEKSPETIRDHLAAVTAMLNHAVENKMLENNPAAQVKFRKRLDDGSKKKRRGYTLEEARRILKAARKETGLLRWGPWIAAHTALRIGEVAQLSKSDVLKRADGTLAIRVNPQSSRVKGHRERIIPVHSALMAEGFPKFVDSCKTERLFPELYHSKARAADPDKIKNYASQRVAAWVRGPKVGINDLLIAPSHSWRHYFNTLSREYELEPDARKAMVGHMDALTSEQYGETTETAKRKQIEKIPPILPRPRSRTGKNAV
jgi:integrase